MQAISCVVDATTLVEHIHEIKSWINSGHLRLVVPLSTYERIKLLAEICNAKAKKRLHLFEQEPSSKAARKELPNLDINPRVAEEFLARLQAPKFANLVIFQGQSEEYTLWKELPVEKESTEEGPTTWAKAAVTSMTAEAKRPSYSEVSKASMKPKSVAQTGSANIPKMPASEFHPAIRPLFSHVLWRFCENAATRGDQSATIVLSNSPKICKMAGMLNLTAHKVERLRRIISLRTVDMDRNSFGDLERLLIHNEELRQDRQFQVAPSVESAPCENDNICEEKEKILTDFGVNGTPVKMNGHQSETVEIEKEEPGEITAAHNVNGGTQETEEGSGLADPEERMNEELYYESGPTVAIDALGEDVQHGVDGKPGATVAINASAEEVQHVVAGEPKFSVVEEKPYVIVAEQQVIPEQSKEIQVKQVLGDLKAGEYPCINAGAPGSVTVSIQRQTTPPKIHAQPQQSPGRQDTTADSMPSSHQSSNGSSPAPAKSASELEDSDEEVVVFNPRAKRLSAQKNAPSQPVSSPSSQVNKARPAPPVKAPSKAPSKASTTAPTTAPTAAPTTAPIIDPDSFGRSFATNPRPNYSQNGYPRYSSRGGPRRGQRTNGQAINQPEVDYVLRSGTTREASRGQGRLWVP